MERPGHQWARLRPHVQGVKAPSVPACYAWGVPDVRASYCKGVVGAAKKHSKSTELMAAISDVRLAIRNAGTLAWVTAEVFVVLTDATLEVLG